MVSTPIADRTATSRASTGIALMLCAMAILPAMDAIGKHLGQILPVLLIVWGRLIFATLFTLPAVLIRHGVAAAIRPQRPLIQVARGFLMVLSTASFFSGLRYLPLADTLAIFSTQAAAKGIALRWQVAPALPAIVTGDPLRLRQILSNLVSNALKFTAHGGVTVSVERAGAGRIARCTTGTVSRSRPGRQ